MDTDLTKLVIANIPNFIGFAIALYFMYQQNKQLLELLRECNARNNGEATEQS